MALMLLHLSSGYAHSAQTTLAWDPPVNTDGTPFTGFTGYKLFVGNTSRSYNQTIDVGNTTSYAVNNLSDGSTYFFAVSDYDGSGNISGYSNEVSKAFPFIYSLTATAGAGGTITPVGNVTSSTATNGTSTITSVTVAQGATQSFTITPNSGYTIATVAIDGISVGAVTSYTFANVTANHTMSATFAPTTYSITASAGTGGSISSSGVATVNSGSSQSYTMTPVSGYSIADVKVDGVSVGAVATYTFATVTANHTIAASFNVITYSVTASAGTSGSVTPAGTSTVNSGSSQSYSIIPAAGYTIADVKVDGVSVGAVATYTFATVTANHTIAASFNVITYSVTASAGTGGSITPSGIATLNYGTSQLYTITPTAGYSIADVKVDGVSVGAVASYTFAGITANHTIAPSFAVITYSVTTTAGTGGSITPSGIATLNYGTSQLYTITPTAGYSIADVKVDGVSVGAVATYTFATVTANHTIAASFAVITYSVTASASTGGSITPSGTATVNSGASQNYTITPATGYTIADVKVDGVSVGAVATYTFATVTANHTIAASFAVITYSVTATAGTGGSITPSSIATVNSGSNQSYTITPATGYTIADVKVDGVSVGAVASYTFTTVTANHTIAASFAVITYSVNASAGTGGSITPAGIATVSYGSSRSYNITPTLGYSIADIKVDGVSVGAVSSYTFAAVTANHTIAASFAVITYSVTATAGTGGSITPSGTSTVNSGASQNYTITPASGYSIAVVKVDGVSVGAVATYTFSTVTANHTITASFAVISYSVTASTGAGGSITPSGTSTVNSGSSQNYSITPASGYSIADIKVDGVSVGAVTSYTFTNVTTNHTIAASFTVIIYTVTASAGTGGSITPSGTATVNSGANQLYTINPATGYAIADVKVDGISLGTIASYTFVNIAVNHTISTTFVTNTSPSTTLTSSTVWLNQSFTSQSGLFTASFDTIPNANNIDAVTVLSAAPAQAFSNGATIVRFNSSGAIDVRNGNIYTSDVVFPYTSGNTYHIRMSVDVSNHVYDVYVSPSGGTEIHLAAGYAFRTEQTSVLGLNNLGIIADINSHKVMNFSITPLMFYTISSSVSTGGSITPAGTATVNSGANQLYTITPATGYAIADVKVDGVSVGKVTSYTFTNIAVNHTISTTFVTSTSPSITLTSSTVWQNKTILTQFGSFTISFDIVPDANYIDALTVLSAGPAQTYTDGAAIIRFNSSGTIDVRNGSVYTADSIVPYTAGKTYHVRTLINVPNHIYDVYVTPPEGTEVNLIAGSSFRTEQKTISFINNLGVFAEISNHKVMNFIIAP